MNAQCFQLENNTGHVRSVVVVVVAVEGSDEEDITTNIIEIIYLLISGT